MLSMIFPAFIHSIAASLVLIGPLKNQPAISKTCKHMQSVNSDRSSVNLFKACSAGRTFRFSRYVPQPVVEPFQECCFTQFTHHQPHGAQIGVNSVTGKMKFTCGITDPSCQFNWCEMSVGRKLIQFGTINRPHIPSKNKRLSDHPTPQYTGPVASHWWWPCQATSRDGNIGWNPHISRMAGQTYSNPIIWRQKMASAMFGMANVACGIDLGGWASGSTRIDMFKCKHELSGTNSWKQCFANSAWSPNKHNKLDQRREPLTLNLTIRCLDVE